MLMRMCFACYCNPRGSMSGTRQGSPQTQHLDNMSEDETWASKLTEYSICMFMRMCFACIVTPEVLCLGPDKAHHRPNTLITWVKMTLEQAKWPSIVYMYANADVFCLYCYTRGSMSGTRQGSPQTQHLDNMSEDEASAVYSPSKGAYVQVLI